MILLRTKLVSKAILVPSWGHLGAILGPSWGHCWTSWNPHGLSWGYLGPSWCHLGAILGDPKRFKAKLRYAPIPTKTNGKSRFWGSRKLPIWLQTGILTDFSPLRRHLGATCRQHGGQDGNLEATWPDLGRTGAVLGGSGAVLGGLGRFGGSKLASSGEGLGSDLRIARALWKTKSSKKRSLQKSNLVQHARATLSATGGGGFNRFAHSARPH